MVYVIKLDCFAWITPNEIVIGTVDIKQLPSLEDTTNTQDRETYVNYDIPKYNIFLTICGGVGCKDTEDRNRNQRLICEMYDYFWVHKPPVEEIIPKHIETTNDKTASEYNIAYTNKRCRKVASEVRSKLGIKDKYVVGDVLISRKWMNSRRINENIRYCIDITRQNISYETSSDLLEEQVDSAFIHSWCATCHSSQGSNINKTMTIHERDKLYLVS